MAEDLNTPRRQNNVIEGVTITRELTNNLVNYMASQGTGTIPFRTVLAMCQQLEDALKLADSIATEAKAKK